MLNQIRFRTSNFVNKKYEKHESEYLKLLGEFEHDPLKQRHKLEIYKNKMFELMNTQTKEYLETNRLLPIPAEYLPYKTENEKKEKRINKSASVLIGKGEMTKYRHQELLEDGDNLIGAGSGIHYKKMNLKDLIVEHKKLIGVLKEGTPKQRITEALEQYHELQGYLKDMK
jgi:hypothetical protein